MNEEAEYCFIELEEKEDMIVSCLRTDVRGNAERCALVLIEARMARNDDVQDALVALSKVIAKHILLDAGVEDLKEFALFDETGNT